MKFADEVSRHDWLIGLAAIRTILDEAAVQLSAYAPIAVVAFSCKRRGFCPSCGARRMAESAALLVDEVFPKQPVCQWVLSFPYPLRFLFASRAAVDEQSARHRLPLRRHALEQGRSCASMRARH